jgi:hypothetical protein
MTVKAAMQEARNSPKNRDSAVTLAAVQVSSAGVQIPRRAKKTLPRVVGEGKLGSTMVVEKPSLGLRRPEG